MKRLFALMMLAAFVVPAVGCHVHDHDDDDDDKEVRLKVDRD